MLSHRRFRDSSSVCEACASISGSYIWLISSACSAGTTIESASSQCFEIFNGCGTEPSKLLSDLSHQQPCRETEVIVLDGMLQMTDRRFEVCHLWSGVNLDRNKGRMIEARFQRVLEFFGGLVVIVLGLCVDRLAEMQHDFRLLGGLHGELSRAAHEAPVNRACTWTAAPSSVEYSKRISASRVNAF